MAKTKTTERFRYEFLRSRTSTVDTAWFGPYEDEDEAKEAFQRRYGYWPMDAIDTQPWTD